MINNKTDLPKSSGVLLHPSSLPSSSNSGTFGKGARTWLKLLASSGIGVWQFLPLSPTDSTGSPYSSPSSFAYDPNFLDVIDLVEEGFLLPSSIEELVIDENTETFDAFSSDVRNQKLGELLRKSWSRQSGKRKMDFFSWREQQFWLDDHVTFMELRRQNNGKPWWSWPTELAFYRKKPLRIWKEQNSDYLLEHSLIQWHLDRQWQSLRHLSQQLGVLLFGDLPFYVSTDSADVWSNKSLFSISEKGGAFMQSGVPPDYFSSTGQLWGTPVYRWQRHKLSRYRWWRARLLRQFQQVDLLRLDHFRALDAFWAIPGNDQTAVNGYWKSSPGLELLNLLKIDQEGKLPLVAEDLGVITDSVERLRDYFELPGMKILQFAFDGNPQNPYLPENINCTNTITYTGTHDNSTTIGWWNELDESLRREISQRFEDINGSPNIELIKIGMKTKSKLFISPLQDLLGLDDTSRFNKPGTIEGNWSWRLKKFDKHLDMALKKYGDIAKSFNRDFGNAMKL